MKEHIVLSKAIIAAKKRLIADAKATFIYHIERILSKFGVNRDNNSMYPREYVKQTEDDGNTLLEHVKKGLEALGFKFTKTPMHTPYTNAVSSTGTYRTLDYIVDIVFRGDELKVDVYF